MKWTKIKNGEGSSLKNGNQMAEVRPEGGRWYWEADNGKGAFTASHQPTEQEAKDTAEGWLKS